MTQNSTTSKRSTASDTATKKTSRWYRLAPGTPPLFDVDLLDLYWGGPERRITGLTLRIIGINAAALLMLLVGIIYLSQYQTTLIESGLKTFKSDAELIANALSESMEEQQRTPAALEATKRLVWRFSKISEGRIILFDNMGTMIVDSERLVGYGDVVRLAPFEDDTLQAVQTLKSMAKFVLRLFPSSTKLPGYKDVTSDQVKDYPDIVVALEGALSMSAWDKDGDVFLTAALPLVDSQKTIAGAVMLTREGRDIASILGDVWVSIIGIFAVTLVITTLLSIYISNTIATPLRNLARAAEAVRRGASKNTEIPDLSDRHDEIGELSVVLRAMTDALWDRMDSIERFAADVAHELKNPLTSMRSAVETLAIVKKDKDREKLMEIINHDVERMDRLITDISSASRLDSELSREELEPVNLATTLETLTARYNSPLLTNQNNVRIILDYPKNKEIIVWGLESRIVQVIENLVTNAISFSPTGGTVTIAVAKTRKMVTITVEDQGPGIPENKLETIFERFYTERPQHEAYGRHSGLGLSICRQIVTAMGGNIFASNIFEEGKRVTGARFTVVLNAA